MTAIEVISFFSGFIIGPVTLIVGLVYLLLYKLGKVQENESKKLIITGLALTILGFIIFFIAILSDPTVGSGDEIEEIVEEVETVKNDSSELAKEMEDTQEIIQEQPVKKELTEEEKKKKEDNEYIKSIESEVRDNASEYRGAKVDSIQVNKNYGSDEEDDYIVLINLDWDVKNGADTTKEMLNMYSDDMAAKLASKSRISDIVIFWKVPYHNESNNSAKLTYTRNDSGMAVVSRDYYI